MYFKGVKLHKVTQASLGAFHQAGIEYADAIQRCLDDRFRDVEQQPVFKGVGILNTSSWAREDSALKEFGLDTLLSLFDHFQGVLVAADREAVVSEWDAFKSYWHSSLHHLSSSDVWLVLAKHQNQYPNLWLLIQILLLFPVSNAIVERGFSAMRRIKTDWRCSLKQETLDHLMRIAIEGPDPSAFDVSAAVDKFFSTPRRPDVQPYKRKHDEITID